MSEPGPTPCVLQVLPALGAGGVERGTLEIAAALVQAGWKAVVASAGGGLVQPLEALGAKHITLPLASRTPWGIRANAAALERVIRQEGVNILHARSRAPAWAGMLAARRTGCHFVTTYHGTYNENFPGKRLYNSVMAKGERVIAISDFIATHVMARHRVPAERLRIIHRGVDTALFDPDAVAPERVERLRRTWGVPDGAVVVMLPARMTRWKGQAVLIQALEKLPARVVAVLVGGGKPAYRAELEKLVAQLRLQDRVRMVGHVQDMPAALLNADIVVHASTDPEAFGRTVVEAMAMARPTIAADLGAPPEVIQPGVTGWLCAPGYPEHLAELIGQILALPAEVRAEIGQAARASVAAHFTTARMQQATLEVYGELLWPNGDA